MVEPEVFTGMCFEGERGEKEIWGGSLFMVNLFDLLVIVLAIGMSVLGLSDGFIGQAVKLGGFLLALVVLAAYSDTFLGIALSFERLPAFISILLVFGGVFILFMLVFHIIAVTLAKLVAITPVQFVDAGFGAALGMVKGLVFCGFLALLLSQSLDRSFFQEQYRGSHTPAPLSRLTGSVIPILKSAAQSIDRALEGIRGKEFKERMNDVQPPADI